MTWAPCDGRQDAATQAAVNALASGSSYHPPTIFALANDLSATTSCTTALGSLMAQMARRFSFTVRYHDRVGL
jgi:hypothetical protein